MRHSGKKIILATALLSSVGFAQADNNTAGNSDAIQFGVQAGSIAGMTQACGQDISTFVTRVNEALNKLATSPTDRVQASAAFQRVLQQTQTMETNNHSVPCIQVLQDYNSLPILRADYQQTVIAQLHPGMPDNTAGTAQPAASATIPSTASPAAPTTAAPATTPTTPSEAAAPQPQLGAAPSAQALQPANNNLQPLSQGGSMPSMPSASTPPPPAPNYNQGALPGSQQQQMTPAPSDSAGSAGATASVPSANLNQTQQQQALPPVSSVPAQ